MLKLDLANLTSETIDRFRSQAATYARIADMGPGGAVAVIHLGPQGRLGLHPARVPQLMVVAAGFGYARGEDEAVQRIGLGDAVVWARGEEHETWTDGGMVLLIIETVDPDLGAVH